jgi:hypothetical protein
MRFSVRERMLWSVFVGAVTGFGFGLDWQITTSMPILDALQIFCFVGLWSCWVPHIFLAKE